MTEPSLLPEILVHEIEELDLRTVFPREDHAFTPWLSQPENLARLARTLGLDIELKATEVGTGIFRTDILGTNLADGATIVIENQFGRSDHDHLGKALTYLAVHEAKIVIWLAEAFADEHRAALTWLNDNTLEDIAFYGIAPKLMRIAGSPPGLRFDVIIAPNSFVKSKKQEARKIDEAVGGVREAFWSAFDEALTGERSLADCRQRYGGRLGFKWILPPVSSEWPPEDEPFCWLGISNASSRDRQGVGINLFCRDAARPEARERLRLAIDRLQAEGIALGVAPADLSTTISTQAAVTELLKKAKAACHELRRAFNEDTRPAIGSPGVVAGEVAPGSLGPASGPSRVTSGGDQGPRPEGAP
jgi:hypothetical protein